MGSDTVSAGYRVHVGIWIDPGEEGRSIFGQKRSVLRGGAEVMGLRSCQCLFGEWCMRLACAMNAWFERTESCWRAEKCMNQWFSLACTKKPNEEMRWLIEITVNAMNIDRVAGSGSSCPLSSNPHLSPLFWKSFSPDLTWKQQPPFFPNSYHFLLYPQSLVLTPQVTVFVAITEHFLRTSSILSPITESKSRPTSWDSKLFTLEVGTLAVASLVKSYVNLALR